MPGKPVVRWKADLILLLVALIWGSTFVVQTYAVAAGLAFLYNAVCFLLASLVLLPFARLRTFAARDLFWVGLAGFLLFAGAGLQQLGLFHTRVANASFLTSTYVVFTPFLLWILYRERAGRIDFLATLLAVIGAFLLCTGGSFVARWGDLLELLGALFWGLHLVVVAKQAARLPSLSFACGQFFVCGALNLLPGLLLEPAAALQSWPVIGSVLYRSLLSIGIGYTLQVWGQKHTPPTDAGLIFAMESVFAAVIAWLLLGEALSYTQLGGCALILAAAALPQLKTRVNP